MSEFKLQDFVVGFAFSSNGLLALVEKKRPDWQAGKLNGIGGKVLPNETPINAMVREFQEETSVEIPALDWQYAGRLKLTNEYSCFVLTTVSDKVLDVKSVTDEKIHLLTPAVASRFGLLENVEQLIQLCLMLSVRPLNVIPTFVLDYTIPRC